MIDTLDIRHLEKKLELKASVLIGEESFSLKIKPSSETSFWNSDKKMIQIGVKGIEDDMEQLAILTMRHEVGHLLFTSVCSDTTNLGYPFSLLNILEDARVEHLMGTDFKPLHESAYKRYYLDGNSNKENIFANPFNVGVLLRWKYQGVQTITEKPPELSDSEYENFLHDWENAIRNSIGSNNTETVSCHAKELYLKWENLFNQHKDQSNALGSIERTADELMGKAEYEEDKPDTSENTNDTLGKELEEYFGAQWFEWDMAYIEKQVRQLRLSIADKHEVEKTFKLLGKHFDPRRICNPPLPPFRVNSELLHISLLKKMLIVIDGSGSMQDDPFKNASHLAYILSMLFPTDLAITTSSSKNPIRIPIESIDSLRSYTAWGDSENYRSLGNKFNGYSFILFLTDANIDELDLDYVSDVFSKMAKIGAAYIGENGHSIDKVFQRTFYTETMTQDLGRMIALFLKRHFKRNIY